MNKTNERTSYSGFINPDFFSVDNLSGERRHLRFNERADSELTAPPRCPSGVIGHLNSGGGLIRW